MTEVTNFITMLGVGIRIAGFFSLIFGLLELGDGKSTNDSSTQRRAQYAIVFGIIFMIFGPNAAAALNSMFNSLNGTSS